MFECLLWLEETGSTQDLLKEGNFPYGTLVVANRQKKGRGRKGRRWESREGGLYFSFVLRDDDFREFLQIPLAVSLGICEFLETLDIKAKIKWPNDVYLMGRKLAGVLAEKSGKKIVVGVGINLNQEEFPPDIESRSISLKLATGKGWDKRDFFSDLLDNLKRVLETYAKGGFKEIRNRVKGKLLYLGCEVFLFSDDQTFRGTFKDIDDKGFLILETEKGNLTLPCGEVSLREVI